MYKYLCVIFIFTHTNRKCTTWLNHRLFPSVRNDIEEKMPTDKDSDPDYSDEESSDKQKGGKREDKRKEKIEDKKRQKNKEIKYNKNLLTTDRQAVLKAAFKKVEVGEIDDIRTQFDASYTERYKYISFVIIVFFTILFKYLMIVLLCSVNKIFHFRPRICCSHSVIFLSFCLYFIFRQNPSGWKAPLSQVRDLLNKLVGDYDIANFRDAFVERFLEPLPPHTDKKSRRVLMNLLFAANSKGVVVGDRNCSPAEQTVTESLADTIRTFVGVITCNFFPFPFRNYGTNRDTFPNCSKTYEVLRALHFLFLHIVTQIMLPRGTLQRYQLIIIRC